jgi:hypothetical protein
MTDTATAAQFTMTPEEREASIVRCLTDMAPNFYPWPGDAARYVIEACFPGATPAEWDFAAQTLAANPQMREGAKRPIGNVLASYREQATAKWQQAGKAATADPPQYGEALALLREAFLLNPAEAEFYARYARIVEDKRAGTY